MNTTPSVNPVFSWPTVEIGQASYATPPAVADLVKRLRMERAFSTGVLRAAAISLEADNVELIRKNLKSALEKLGEPLI